MVPVGQKRTSDRSDRLTLDLVDLLGEVLVVRDGRGELSSLGETGAEQTGISHASQQQGARNIPRNLLDQGLGGEESVVLLGELLDELLVLVELLQVLNGHEGELLVELLGSEGQRGHLCTRSD